MALTLAELSEIAGTELRGDGSCLIHRVASLSSAGVGEISFLTDPKYKKHLDSTSASAVILSAEHVADCPVNCLVSENPYLAHARVATALHPPRAGRPGVHPTSVVEPTADVSASAEVGANCYIGAGVVLCEDVVIGPGCVLLDDVYVGAESRLLASVTLCSATKLGSRCLIHPGTVIGSDGFGLANDNGAWVKVPQIGCVVLGDDVEIGASCSVDRGAIGNTEIADGVKIDNQVHIAHNVKVGRHTAIAGCVGIAGSTTIGAQNTLAGGALVTGHIELADNVHISGATVVTRSIRKPGLYTGTVPSMEHAGWLKNFARLRHLDDMVRRVKTLEKELAAIKGRGEAQS